MALDRAGLNTHTHGANEYAMNHPANRPAVVGILSATTACGLGVATAAALLMRSSLPVPPLQEVAEPPQPPAVEPVEPTHDGDSPLLCDFEDSGEVQDGFQVVPPSSCTRRAAYRCADADVDGGYMYLCAEHYEQYKGDMPEHLQNWEAFTPTEDGGVNAPLTDK